MKVVIMVTAMSALIALFAMSCSVSPREHIRGVVTQISARSISVQTADKATKTLTLTDQTIFRRSGKAAHLADVKVGDRVVVDVPEKTTNALLIQIGAAAKPPSHK